MALSKYTDAETVNSFRYSLKNGKRKYSCLCRGLGLGLGHPGPLGGGGGARARGGAVAVIRLALLGLRFLDSFFELLVGGGGSSDQGVKLLIVL